MLKSPQNTEIISIKLQWIEKKLKLQKTFLFQLTEDGSANSFKIGREPNYWCDLRLEDLAVEWFHGEIYYKNKSFYLKLLDSDTTEVKDDKGRNINKPSKEDIALQEHYKIICGKTELEVVEMHAPQDLDGSTTFWWKWCCALQNYGALRFLVFVFYFIRLCNCSRGILIWVKAFFACVIDAIISFLATFIIIVLILLIWWIISFFTGLNLFDLDLFRFCFILLICSPFLVYPAFFECKFSFKERANKNTSTSKSLIVDTIPNRAKSLIVDTIPNRASIGKRMVGIYVGNSSKEKEGTPISAWQSLGRYFTQPLFILFGLYILEFPVYQLLVGSFAFPDIHKNGFFASGILFVCLFVIVSTVNLITSLFTVDRRSLREKITGTKLFDTGAIPILDFFTDAKNSFRKSLAKNPILLLLLCAITLWVIYLFITYPERLYKRGNEEVSDRNYEKAIEYYKQAIESRSNYFDAYLALGNAQLKLDKKEAINNYSDAIRVKEESFSKEECFKEPKQGNKRDQKNCQDLANAYFKRGNTYYDLDFKKNAIKDYTEALKYQQSPNAFMELGNAYADLGDMEKADKNKAIAYYNQAIENYTQAIKHIKDAGSDYTPADAYYNRGYVYGNLGDKETDPNTQRQAIENYKQAIKDYSQAITFKPDDADTYYNRGFVYSRSGKTQEARKDFQEAARLYQQQGNSQEAEEARSWANQIR